MKRSVCSAPTSRDAASQSHRQGYRAELDGVRAVAVLAVLFFHAGYEWMAGGYLGVDMFFVLSGFLIIGIILDGNRAGTFSFAEFYARRFRRIGPALILMVACTIAIARLVSIPGDLAETASSAFASLLSFSNIFFWMRSGYFDSASEYKPLLHTWSLSLEEQMYLFLPAAIAVLLRVAGWSMTRLMAPAALAMFLASAIFAELYPSASFYLPPTRVWEFLCGGALAVWTRSRDARHASMFTRAEVQVLTITGVAILLVSLIWIRPGLLSAPLSAAPAVVGTCILIAFAVPGTWMGRILSARPLVLLGLASYSIYLWHQPIFAFARQVAGSHIAIEGLRTIALAAVAIGVGILSWRLVEQPYRHRETRGAKQLMIFSIPLIAMSVAGGLYWADLSRASEHLPREVVRIAEPEKADPHGCRLTSGAVTRGEVCSFGYSEVPPKMALVGDSHARRLTGALDAELSRKGIGGLLYADSWCVPIPTIRTDSRVRNPECPEFIESAISRIEASNIEIVVLAAQWPAYVDGWRTGDTTPVLYRADHPSDKEGASDLFARELARLIERLRASGKEVVLVMTVPEYSVDVPSTLARRILHAGRPYLSEEEQIDVRRYEQRNLTTRKMLARSGLSPLNIVETRPLLCPQSKCLVVAGLNPLYEDESHLSLEGARIVAPELMSRVERILLGRRGGNDS